MTSGRLGPLDIDVCVPCGGVWLDSGELGQIIAAGPEVVRRLGGRLQTPAPGSTGRSTGTPMCPVCRAPLTTREYPTLIGVWLDTCQWCEGNWITSVGLGRLAVAIGGGSVWDQHHEEVRAAPGSGPDPGRTEAVPPGAPPSTPARPGTLICTRCSEVNTERAAVCWACGHPFHGPVVGSCPHCEADMRRVTAGEVTFSACGGCSGIWITPNRLNQLIKYPPPVRQRLVTQIELCNPGLRRAAHSLIQCPECRISMAYGPMGVISREPIHACTRCFGLYLEPGRSRAVLLTGK